MADSLDKEVGLINRRDFLTRSALIVGATAALHAMTRNLPFSPFRNGTTTLSAADSIFLPKPGARLRYWRSRLDRLRLR